MFKTEEYTCGGECVCMCVCVSGIEHYDRARKLSGRTPDSQLREPGFESPFATVSKFGHFHSLHNASVHSSVFK